MKIKETYFCIPVLEQFHKPVLVLEHIVALELFCIPVWAHWYTFALGHFYNFAWGQFDIAVLAP